MYLSDNFILTDNTSKTKINCYTDYPKNNRIIYELWIGFAEHNMFHMNLT